MGYGKVKNIPIDMDICMVAICDGIDRLFKREDLHQIRKITIHFSSCNAFHVGWMTPDIREEYKDIVFDFIEVHLLPEDAWYVTINTDDDSYLYCFGSRGA
jgi:hypothetical protein